MRDYKKVEEYGSVKIYSNEANYKIINFLCSKGKHYIYEIIMEPVCKISKKIFQFSTAIAIIVGVVYILAMILKADVLVDTIHKILKSLSFYPWIIGISFTTWIISKFLYATYPFGFFGSTCIVLFILSIAGTIAAMREYILTDTARILWYATGACSIIKVLQVIVYHVVYGIANLKDEINRKKLIRKQKKEQNNTQS